VAFGTKLQEKFEYIKGIIRSCKSKDRQHNGQKKKDVADYRWYYHSGVFQ
jgi:hypothetical protein